MLSEGKRWEEQYGKLAAHRIGTLYLLERWGHLRHHYSKTTVESHTFLSKKKWLCLHKNQK